MMVSNSLCLSYDGGRRFHAVYARMIARRDAKGCVQRNGSGDAIADRREVTLPVGREPCLDGGRRPGVLIVPRAAVLLARLPTGPTWSCAGAKAAG